MKRLVLVAVLSSMLSVFTFAGGALADHAAASDPLEGLTDVEKAYVNRMRGAYAAALSSLDKLSGDIGGAALGALFGTGTPEPAEMLNMVLTCRAGLSSAAPAFRDAPPSSMDGLASMHSTIASRLDAAFSPMMGILYQEGKERILQAGREWLGDGLGGALGEMLGVDSASDKPRSSVKARLLSSVLGEISDLRSLLSAGQGALDARVREISGGAGCR